LACRDFGGDGAAVLLLHGLAGHADEWTETASWLTKRCRVVAFDARGHGHSERFPGGFSDLELALLTEAGLVDDATTIVTTVHPLQLDDETIAAIPVLAARRPS
jgi:pimeloyl-ACP methyl ester carboxylesterase